MGKTPSTYTGANATQKQIRALKKNAPQEFAAALHAEMLIEQKEIVEETPKRTGQLREDITVDEPTIEGNRIKVLIHTTEKTAHYALEQHENLDIEHEVGGPKFIERPLKASASSMPSRIAARVDLNKALQ